MSNKVEYVSDEEMKDIENVEVDENIETKIKNKKADIIYKELLNKALDEVRKSLEFDEYIEEKIIGRDYKADTTRIIVAGAGSIIAHPIFDWSSAMILIKTNKRLLLLETAQYFKYLRHYEVENKVTIYSDEELVYLSLNNLESSEKVIQNTIDCKDNIVKKLKENNIAFEISNNEFVCTEKVVVEKQGKLFWIGGLIILIILLYNLITKGPSLYGY
ncbi:Uncharacterised protein [uncultured Clostridium sp.]|uniref:hypothetical protein n=1 Tax=uncultured Clostridium sp. TaxID=59620 RepID=UPI000822557D|nr:hypothetical protein [uncultured Clostridium sp.]SCJ32512.1 Uncharacterised protein [uncultured Clostridium sp.]